jgi:hypothetical protein
LKITTKDYNGIDLSPNPSPREGGVLRTINKVPLSPGKGGFRG